MIERNSLSKNILQTIVYYDVLDFPLTSFEIWKYLITEVRFPLGKSNFHCALVDVVEELERDEIRDYVEEFCGFYFLKGRRSLVARRIQNEKNSITKFEIAKYVVWWMRFVPFVRMIAITGTLAMKSCVKDSDIDFFVVLEKGRIFTGRLLVTALVHFLGRRRYGRKIKNRICLNYFVTTENLEIERKDLFAANEYSFIYPMFNSSIISAKEEIRRFDNFEFSSIGFGALWETSGWSKLIKQNTFKLFCKNNIEWIKNFKPNFEYGNLESSEYCIKHSRFSEVIQRFFECLINTIQGDRIESWLRKWQIARIKNNPLTCKESAYVEATDKSLIFLPKPRSLSIKEEWQRRIYSLDREK